MAGGYGTGEPGSHPADPANPAPTAYEWLARLLVAVGAGTPARSPATARRSTWQCPAHDDASPSLSLGYGRHDDRAVIHCHAGCTTPDVLAALSCPARYLFTPPPVEPEDYAEAFCAGLRFPTMRTTSGHPREAGLRLVAVHEYGRPARAWLERWRHPVTGAKDIRWEALNERGERVPTLGDGVRTSLPLYREHDLGPALGAGEPVLVVESESTVDALHGHYATTWAGGAGSPNLDALRRVLGDHDRVLVIADADDAGRECAVRIGEALPLARVHAIPGDDHADARDLLARLGPAAFARLVETEVGR